MKEKTLQNGFRMPVLGLGTWGFGGRAERDPASRDEEESAVIRQALEMGYRHIDTAEMYASGHSETLVGNAIRGFRRESLFLSSKVWKTHLRFDDVLRALEGSLQRLGTDYLDLYLIHQAGPELPAAESIRAMNRLKSEKLIRAIGVSNFAVPRLEEALRAAESPIAANQVHYSLCIREAEESGMLRYCQEHDIMLIAWRPLRDIGCHGRDSSSCPLLLRRMAEKYGKTPSQIALNFLTSQKNVVTISASHNLLHLRENLESADFSVDPEDLERLRREYPGKQSVSPAVPLV